MRETMVYNPRFYQLRDYMISTISNIIKKNRNCTPGGVVFFGDSITEWYDIEKYYPEIDIKYNSGVAGFTSESLKWICDEGVIKYKPKVVVLMVGTNDLGNTLANSPRDIALNVKTIVDLISGNLPDVKIVLVSTLPCVQSLHGVKAGKYMRSNYLIKMIFKEYKEQLAGFKNVTFVNAFDALYDEKTGDIKEGLSKDGLHLTELGYNRYTEIIKPVILDQYK